MSQEELHDFKLKALIKSSDLNHTRLLDLHEPFKKAQGDSLPWVREYDAYKRIIRLEDEVAHLLDALEFFVDYISETVLEDELRPQFKAARAAIAKAKEET